MIEINGIGGGYAGAEVIGNLSLTIPNGEITTIIGPNGCGKSTLLKMICAQLIPKSGEILADGKSLAEMSRTEIARSISYLPQSRSIPDIMVKSLVLHGRFPWVGYPRVYREQDKRAAEIAMEKAGISHKREKPLSELSGGERQKVYIAMVLAQDTPHVLLDEPATYLDIARQLELVELLKLLKSEGKAVAAVLHDITTALDIADRVVVMKDGEILKSPTEKAIETAFGVKIKSYEKIAFALD